MLFGLVEPGHSPNATGRGVVVAVAPGLHRARIGRRRRSVKSARGPGLTPSLWAWWDAVIPYWEIPELGPIKPFGLLVAIGVLIGAWYTRKRGAANGITDKEMSEAILWVLVGGFVVAHWVAVIFYFPDRLMAEGPILLLKVWKYLSSVGGFLGAFIGLALWFRKNKKSDWLPFMDSIVEGLVVGWIFGRAACTAVHDHPGKLTDFFLGIHYPDGVRHDLGLYEMLFTLLILLPVTLGMHRLKPPAGSYLAVVSVLYAPLRFFLDFLRKEDGTKSDMRYLGLTPAQYATLALLLAGIYVAVRVWRRQQAPAEGLQPAVSQSESNRRKRNRKRRKKKR